MDHNYKLIIPNRRFFRGKIDEMKLCTWQLTQNRDAFLPEQRDVRRLLQIILPGFQWANCYTSGGAGRLYEVVCPERGLQKDQLKNIKVKVL